MIENLIPSRISFVVKKMHNFIFIIYLINCYLKLLPYNFIIFWVENSAAVSTLDYSHFQKYTWKKFKTRDCRKYSLFLVLNTPQNGCKQRTKEILLTKKKSICSLILFFFFTKFWSFLIVTLCFKFC